MRTKCIFAWHLGISGPVDAVTRAANMAFAARPRSVSDYLNENGSSPINTGASSYYFNSKFIPPPQRRRGSANDAEVGAGGATQFLGLLRIAAGTSLGTLHQLVRHAASGRDTLGQRQKTGDLGDQAVHIQVQSHRTSGEKLRWLKVKGFP